jgi:hypothetical protein
MNISRLIVAPLLLLAAAGASADQAHNYPTQARVEYVFDCMRKHGGENYDNLYKCSCSIDYIASKMTYDQFVTADTFMRGAHAMGEREQELREGAVADINRATLNGIQAQAAKHCGLPKPLPSTMPK